MTFIKNIRSSTLSIIIVALACFIIDISLKNWEKQDRVIEQDVHWYYFYLPATFIYDDIKQDKSDYQFEKDYDLFRPIFIENGGKVNKTTMGLSFMYAPFFFVAHLYALLSDYPEDGFSEPYKILLLLSSIFYLILGLDFLRKTLLYFNFSEQHSAITILLIGLGTNLLCYSSQSAAMPHSYSFCLFSIFIFCTIKWHSNSSTKNTVIIGLLLGLISLVRPSNILIFIFFFLYGISNWKEFKQRLVFFKSEAFLINVIFLCALLVWIPQFMYWKTTTGNYIYDPYLNEKFFLNHPRIIEGLFSFRKGWLVYAPIMAFSLIGMFLPKNETLKTFRLSIFVFLTLNVYLIFSWWCWWYGTGFGQRSLVESYALLAIPLACFVRFVTEKKLFIILFCSISGFFIWLNVFQTFQFENASLHRDGMTKELYFKQFGKMKKIPDYDKYVSLPDYDEARKGNDSHIDTPPVKDMLNVSDYKGRKEQKRNIINLTAANGRFVCADESMDFNVIANKDKAYSWEEFTLIFFDENECAISSYRHLFLSTELNHKQEITATRKDVGAWEIFTLVNLGNGFVAFKASNGKYLSLDNNSLQIIASGNSIGENEKFKIIAK